MNIIKKIAKVNELPHITDLIHDCWFDVDEIVFDHQTSVLSIRFEKELPESIQTLRKILFIKKKTIPIAEYFLKIHHVQDYKIDDQNQIGKYDFNKLEYMQEKQIIIINTGVPIGIEIKVGSFEVSVEKSGKILKERKFLSIFN